MTTTSFSQDIPPIDVENDITALRPLQASSLEDRAYKRIEKMILSGELKGAERINDTQLAKAFSTSRGPVRNALARLAEAGLIELIPYRGAFVKKIDLDDVMEIYEARAAIERAAVLAAGRNMTSKHQTRLKYFAEAMKESLNNEDTQKYFELNLQFHQFIHETSGNSRLIQLYERYTREQRLFRHFSVTSGGMYESYAQHLEIINNLLDGDILSAANSMEQHVLSAKKRLQQSMKKAQKNDNA